MTSRQTRNKYVLNLVVNMFEGVSLKDVKVTLLYGGEKKSFAFFFFFCGPNIFMAELNLVTCFGEF